MRDENYTAYFASIITETEKKYADILYQERPEDAAFFRKHPRIAPEERAKIFSPFAALRGHDDRLAQERQRAANDWDMPGEQIDIC